MTHKPSVQLLFINQLGGGLMKKAMVWLLVLGLLASFNASAIAAQAGKIDINKASAEELTQLQKVGPTTAERIVAYRKANGPFKSPDDLMQVKGVGEKILELNKDRITVGKP
jgi:competence protein ComEA